MALSELLREHTRTAHRDAERTGIVRAMLDGTVKVPQYRLWLRNLHVVYETLEAELAAQPVESVAAVFADPTLFRTGSIASDMCAMLGTGWVDLPVLPAARAYCNHLRQFAGVAAPGLLGHGYVRYLGDLSGGQLLRGLLRDRLGLSTDALSYYEFPDISDTAARREALRAGMDRCVLAPEEVAVVLEEALAGFRLTMALASEVCSGSV